MNDTSYGQVVSPKEAGVLTGSMLPGIPSSTDTEISQVGNALWSYKFEHKINGIPVALKDCNLPVDREDLLFAAFKLDPVPRSVILWLSPDDTDAVKQYDELLKQAHDGSIMIVDEIKQYDESKGKFIAWIRYNEMQYSLHPRFTYLREDMKNDQ